MKISRLLIDYVGVIPFLAITKDGGYTPRWDRVIELIVIAALTAFMSGQIVVAKLEVRMTNIEDKVDKLIEDVYTPKWENE